MAQELRLSISNQDDVIREYPVDFDENSFQGWYKERATKLGLDPNPDAPEQFYDYRSAFTAGAEPDTSGHWPSEFKQEGHPNLIVDGINTKTGEPATKIQEFDVSETDESLWEKLYGGVFNAPEFVTKPATGFAESMSQPSLVESEIPFLPELKGFVGGAVEGASKLLSPANIASTAMPYLKPIASAVPITQKILGALQLGHGASEISQGNKSEGLGDIGFGLLDIATSAPNLGKLSPVNQVDETLLVKSTLENQQIIKQKIEDAIKNFEATNVSGGLKKPGDPKKIVIEEIGMTEGDIDDLRTLRQYHERLSKMPKGGDFSEKFLKVFPEYKGKFGRITGFNEGAVGVETIDGRGMSIGRDDITGVALPIGRDYQFYGYQNPVSHPERFDREGNFIPQRPDQPIEGVNFNPVTNEPAIRPHGDPSRDADLLAIDRGMHEEKMRVRENEPFPELDPADKGVVPSLSPIEPIVQLTPTQKLFAALDETKELNAKQREIYKLERAERFGRAEDVDVKTEADLGKFFGQLKGEHTKVEIDPLRPRLEQTDIDALLNTINNSPLPVTESANAYTGLNKLLEGKVPTDYEAAMLTKVFGGEFADKMKKFQMRPRRLAVELASVFKGYKSAGDLGFNFRQGINYAGRSYWWKSFLTQIKAWGSTKSYQASMERIHADPMYSKAQRDGLAFTDLHGLNNREEAAMSTFAERTPVIGVAVKAGNRAYTIAANEIRMEAYKDIYGQYKNAYQSAMKLAKTADEIKEAKYLNPDNPYVGKRIADMVNTATGRGRLPGNLEKIIPELNAGLFAPKLISARIRSVNRILNPVSYWNYDKVQRKEAIRQLVSIAGTAITTGTMFKVMGGDVSFNPDSSDFLKVKLGDFRLDPLGGYQQYFVPIAKMYGMDNLPFPSATGTATPVGNGRRYKLGGYGKDSRFDIGERALTSKAAPLAGLVVAWMKGRTGDGKPVNFDAFELGAGPEAMQNNTMFKQLIEPMILEDIEEMIAEDPTLLLALPLSATGMGASVYDQ